MQCVHLVMAELWGWQNYFAEVQHFLRQIQVVNARQDHIEHWIERLETIVSGTARIRDILSAAITGGSQQQDTVLQYYKTSLDELLESLYGVNSYLDSSLDSAMSAPYTSSTVRTGARGRPRFNITVDQLEYLTSMSFSWTEIARMLGISRMTLYRRRVQFGMAQQGRSISDNELTVLLREMRRDYPYMGEVMVLGRLRALGYAVRRDRVRRAIRLTDPINSALRATTGPVARRVYSVPGPNSLWHMGMYTASSLGLPLPGRAWSECKRKAWEG